MDFNRAIYKVMKKWYIILVTIIIGLAGGIGASIIFDKKEYSSSADVFVESIDFIDDNGNRIELTSKVMGDFMSVAKSNAVLEEVAKSEALKGAKYTSDRLRDSVEVTRVGSLITIEITTQDATMSKTVADAYINVGLPKVKSIIDSKSGQSTLYKLNYSVISEAEEGRAVNSQRVMFIMFGILAGIAIGIIVIFLSELTGKAPYRISDVATIFDTRLMAVIIDPKVRTNKSKNQYVDSKTVELESQASVSSLAASIINSDVKKIAVAPACHGCGASELVLQLGKSLSESHKVLVIDCDFRNAGLSRAAGMDGVGLSEYLLSQTGVDTILNRVGKLTVIPAGAMTQEGLIKILGGELDALLAEQASKFDYIIMDTPSLEDYRDLVSICGIVKDVAIVFDATTSKKRVIAAIDMVDQSELNLVGVVVNNYPFSYKGDTKRVKA